MSEPAPQFRFYHAENCNRHIRSGDHILEFQPYQYLGGCWYGILATAVPAEQAALKAMAGDPRNGICEITEAQFQAKYKKKGRDALEIYAPLASESLKETLPLAPTKSGKPAQVVERPEPSVETEVSSEPLPTANDALDVGEVKS